MPRFHELEVAERRIETPDCVRILFRVPPALRETFRYRQGQHLILRVFLDGAELRRTYSICASVDEARLEIAVKRQPHGRVSNWIHDHLRVGDRIEVMPPAGHFFVPLEPEAARLHVAFAAGSGITPVFSILKTTLEREPKSRFMLFYGNREPRSIIFREELEGLRNRYLGRLLLFHLLTRASDQGAFAGRITPDKLRSWAGRLFVPAEVDAWYICGPAPMIQTLADTLGELGVPEERVHYEYFTPRGNRPRPAPHAAPPPAARGRRARILLRLDGRRYAFDMPFEAETILDAARAQGIDVPYSCTAGVCATCRARVVAGKVDMATNYALESWEIRRGHILTCQARPLTEEVELDFEVF